MPDSASDHDPTATPLRNPHRPAPPVPASKKSMTATEEDNIDEIEVLDDSSSIYSTSKKMRRAKQMSRRTLRQRKIHSVKRQIQIKEKMLEVII